MKLPITDDGTRPAGPQDQCLYCKAPKGAHTRDCVCLRRTVVVRVTREVILTMPASWGAAEIEAHQNHGSACADDVLREMWRQTEAKSSADSCSCSITRIEYVREATEEDHEMIGWREEAR